MQPVPHKQFRTFLMEVAVQKTDHLLELDYEQVFGLQIGLPVQFYTLSLWWLLCVNLYRYHRFELRATGLLFIICTLFLLRCPLLSRVEGLLGREAVLKAVVKVGSLRLNYREECLTVLFSMFVIAVKRRVCTRLN